MLISDDCFGDDSLSTLLLFLVTASDDEMLVALVLSLNVNSSQTSLSISEDEHSDVLRNRSFRSLVISITSLAT